MEREREITPEEVRQAKKAEADEARARGDSDVREAKRAKTEPAASDPDAQKALETQKKRVAQLEDQLGTATEEKLFAKSAADAATTAHAALLAQKARAVATARSEDPETRAKALRLEGELRTATAKLDAAVAKRDAAQKRADGCLARLAAAEALGRDAAAKGLADWQTRLDAARTARKKSEAACKQATDASRALEAACAALRGAAQTAHQLVEEERRLELEREDARAKAKTRRSYTLFLLPRRSMVCEKVLQDEGVLELLTVREVGVQLIPLEDDVLSLELPCFRECWLDGDPSAPVYPY